MVPVQLVCSARLRAVCAALCAANGPEQAGQVARAALGEAGLQVVLGLVKP